MKDRTNKEKTNIENGKVLRGMISFCSFLIFLVAVVIGFGSWWIRKTYNVGAEAVYYTLKSNTGGVPSEMIKLILYGAILPVALILAVYIIYGTVIKKRQKLLILRKLSVDAAIKLNLLGCIVVLVASIFIAEWQLGVVSYIGRSLSPSEIIEEEYVKPTNDNITLAEGQKKRNVIVIYMESMENTYARGRTNYMPLLTKLAKDNISFADELSNGYHACNGATWTMGAVFTTSSGLPFKFNSEQNEMGERKHFAPNVITLGDVLNKQGYKQELLLGSNSEFAGMALFYKEHGNFNIYDFNTALEEGKVSSQENWGFTDTMLYSIAKERITAIAKEGQPFHYTMQTIDTHAPEGYVCSQCNNKYTETTANVVDCADRQIDDFISWCKKQSWYENTTIVIIGDHPRMDTCLVKGYTEDERGIYNCFINSVAKTEGGKNRIATSVDIFPSILAAMGYEIVGDRLGIGTNLFSDTLTLAEEMGYETFNMEIDKKSKFFTKNFDTE